MATWAEHVPGNLVMLGLRRIPGAAHECALPHQARPPGASRPHAQRFRRRRRPRADRGDGELSGRRRLDRGAAGVAALYGRHEEDRSELRIRSELTCEFWSLMTTASIPKASIS